MSKNNILKTEYDTIVKYVNYYIKKYNYILANFNNEYHKDIIFTQSLNKFLKYKIDIKTNKEIIKYISLLVRSVVINFIKDNKNAFNNEIQTLENPLNIESVFDDEIDKLNPCSKYLSQNDTNIDEFIFNDSLSFIYSNLNPEETKLLDYLNDNPDSYKYSISKICRDLSITRRNYDTYIHKIQELCKLYLLQ